MQLNVEDSKLTHNIRLELMKSFSSLPKFNFKIMFQFIKNLFKSGKSSSEHRIPVEEARLVTEELLLASFLHLLTVYVTNGAFAKNYQCVAKFINQGGVPIEDNPLEFSDLVNLDTFENKEILCRSGIIKFAKRYTLLSCKCFKNPEFDSWMERLATINTAY